MLSRNSFLKFVSHYPARHLTTDHHQALVAERSKALQLSCRGLAGRGFESRWRHIFSFWIFHSLPFRTGQRIRCKWNQACPFIWSHSCFRPRYDLSYKALYISTCSIALNIYTTFHRDGMKWIEMTKVKKTPKRLKIWIWNWTNINNMSSTMLSDNR